MQKTSKELIEDILSSNSTYESDLEHKVNSAVYIGIGSTIGALVGYQLGDDVAASVVGSMNYGLRGLLIGGLVGQVAGYIEERGLKYIIPVALAFGSLGIAYGSLDGINNIMNRDTTGGIFSVVCGALIGGTVGYWIKKRRILEEINLFSNL